MLSRRQSLAWKASTTSSMHTIQLHRVHSIAAKCQQCAGHAFLGSGSCPKIDVPATHQSGANERDSELCLSLEPPSFFFAIHGPFESLCRRLTQRQGNVRGWSVGKETTLC